MQQYIGTHSLQAKPMTLEEYNAYRGWETLKGEDINAKGYLVQHSDGFCSWYDKTEFDKIYACNGSYNFGHALWLLERGARVQRSGWNGKGMFLFKVATIHNLKVNREPLLSILGEGATFNYQSHIDMFTADGTIVPWLCSQTDMQASDWQIVPNS